MSFKTYLKALLGRFWSKTENDDLAQVRTLSDSPIELGESFTAPSNGIVVVRSLASGNTGKSLVNLSNSSTSMFSDWCSGNDGNGFGNSAEVKKGIAYSVYKSNATVEYVRFFEFIGGGLARLFKAEVYYAFA